MPERKVWTGEEDKILRYLREERKQKKWANIARIMEEQFDIKGRTGKQCRERYHNHLDSNIVNSQWTPQQEELLFHLHEELGNKWSAISQRIAGRSDNCVKNHFYSKLRKSARKLNKIIQQIYKEEYRPIKNCMLSKIIQITQSKFKNNTKEDQQFIELCNDIKNRLFRFEVVDLQNLKEEELLQSKYLIEIIESFDKDYRKNHKSSKKYPTQAQFKIYLKPPKPFLVKRQNSYGSNSSEPSEDNLSFLSSVSNLSSCSDLSEYERSNKKILSSANSTPSFNSFNISPANSQGNIRIENGQQQPKTKTKIENPAQFEKCHQNLIVEQQSENYDANKQQISQHYDYNNMFYDDTPVMARIFAPNYCNMEIQGEAGLFGHKQSDEQIIYRQQQKHGQ